MPHSTSDRPTTPARAQTALLLAAAALLLTVLLVPSTPAVRADDAGSQASAAERSDVILYMTDWCGWCRKTRALLNEIGADFEEVDIEKSEAGRKEFEAKSGGQGGIPLIDIDGTIIRGYDEARIRRLVAELEKSGGDEA